jgi:hypothetical protein
MASPKSQLRKLYDGIRNAPPIAQWKAVNCPVYLGSKFMTKDGAPPRIVIFPVKGSFLVARKRDPGGSLRDVDRSVAVHLWGADFDQLEELESRFFQALDYQAVGGLPSSSSVTPGTYWQSSEEQWDMVEDSSKQGEAVVIVLTAINSIEKVAQTFGHVDSIAISLLATTLSAQLLAGDANALANTSNLPSAGVMTIDAEQIRYTGTTPSSFTGLVRGINGTTPATHSAGAVVNVIGP